MTDSIGTSCESIGSTSSSLLVRVKARDQEAWGRLVRLYGPLVAFWIRRAGLQDADARDVFQEVFAAVAKESTSSTRTGRATPSEDGSARLPAARWRITIGEMPISQERLAVQRPTGRFQEIACSGRGF